MKPFIRIARRITVAATAIGATALTVGAATPALATEGWSVSVVRLEHDTFSVKDPTATGFGFSGGATVVLDRNHVRVGSSGVLTRSTTIPGCRAARAVFTYADGSTSSVTSPRLCQEFGTFRSDPSFYSRTDRDVLRYAVQILSASDATAPLTVIAGNTQYVGDAPDSLGTTTRLDHDTHVLKMTANGRTETMFTGSTDYFLQKHEVSAAGFTWWTPRARVTGTLTWSDLITGTEAYLSVAWTYADGSTSSTISAKVVRGSLPSRTITLTSSSSKQVVAVSMAVYSNQAGPGGGTYGSEGHFLDPTNGQ